MINEENVGKFFTDEMGWVWELISYAKEPTATMRCLGSGETSGGCVGSLNLSGFTLVEEPKQDLIRAVVSQYGQAQWEFEADES